LAGLEVSLPNWEFVSSALCDSLDTETDVSFDSREKALKEPLNSGFPITHVTDWVNVSPIQQLYLVIRINLKVLLGLFPLAIFLS